MSRFSPAVFAITPGEPAGIGPDICLSLPYQSTDDIYVLFANKALIEQRAQLLDKAVTLHLLPDTVHRNDLKAGVLNIIDVPLKTEVTAGQLNPANASYILETLTLAVDACQSGLCDALVTGPVHKGVINDSGTAFSGHTEFLADLVNADPVMMLACPGLRVALVTTHLPVSAISSAISKETVERVLRITHHDLVERFGIRQPEIYCCGLNPHAGENGHLGMEEIDTIIPVIEKLNNEGLKITGPLPADTIFNPGYLEHADVVVAMYHDQGLPVLKHMGFGQAVNVTLGLPIIRTSVDHGTALDLAGTGKAETGSLLFALETAKSMLGN